MSNTSATGGYLAPAGTPAPLEGQALYRFLHDLIAGITSLPGAEIRPRWQPEPPNLPTYGNDWAAFGITKRTNRKFAYVRHVPAVASPAAPGYDEYQTHEEMEILVSFYGPNADINAAVLRDGLYIPQNLEVLQLNAMGLVDTGDLMTVPSLVKERWLYRVDLPVTIRRQILRQYPILDLVGADVVVNNEQYTTAITVI